MEHYNYWEPNAVLERREKQFPEKCEHLTETRNTHKKDLNAVLERREKTVPRKV